MNLASRTRLRRIGIKIAFAVTLAASLGVAYAFKTIFTRPGEAALQFVPADALVVGTLDLNPSPAQALAFKRIDDAMDRNGMNRFVESSVLDLFGHNDALDELKPYVQRNGAIALLPAENHQMMGLMLLSLSDPRAAQAALAKKGKPAFFRGTKYYAFKDVHSYFMVMGDLLAIGEKPQSLHAARMVAEGQASGITSVPEFAEARKHLADDANVMAFFNPKMLGDTDVAALKNSKASWLAAGLAIRDGGLGLSVWNQFAPDSIKGFSALAKTQAIRQDLFQVLPSGAYGMFVVSQPANYFDQFESVVSQEKEGDKVVPDLAKQVQDNIGLDLHNDLLKGLRGNAVVAAYPATTDNAGADVLLVIDDQNGSDPAGAVAKFQQYVKQQTEKEANSETLWVEHDVDGATGFQIAPKVEQDMRKGFGDGMDPDTIRKDVLVDKKTVAWAVVGNTVLASSSDDLLKRAVASFRSHAGALVSDPDFAKANAEVTDGSQIMAMFDLGRIAAGVGNTVSTKKMDKDAADAFKSVTGAFEKIVDPFYLKARLGEDGQVSFGAFIPIDYDKAFDFIGKQMNHHR